MTKDQKNDAAKRKAQALRANLRRRKAADAAPPQSADRADKETP